MTTSLKPCMNSENSTWLYDYLRIPIPQDNEKFDIGNQKFILIDGILRNQCLITKNQTQTQETFGFKWRKRDTFDSEASLAHLRAWLLERYGDIESSDWLPEHGKNPILIDAGCGVGRPALELFGNLLENIDFRIQGNEQNVDHRAHMNPKLHFEPVGTR